LVSSTDRLPAITPIDLFERGRQRGDVCSYWERPDEKMALVGIGAAHTLELHGDHRFDQANSVWSELLDGALVDDGSMGLPACGPVLLGGFSFDPSTPKTALWSDFSAGFLVLPRYLLTMIGQECWLTINRVLGPESDPDTEVERTHDDLLRIDVAPQASDGCSSDRDDFCFPIASAAQTAPSLPEDVRSAESWKALVGDARRAIHQGEAEKIVLARAVRVRDGDRLLPANALRRLRREVPSGCTLFALARGESCFLGATPESLVRLHERTVEVSCLAGTIGRGSTEEEDGQLGARLLGSAKDRAEHAVVVRTLQEQLAAFCDDLEVPAGPVLMKLRNVQHLYTPLCGHLSSADNILALVERLHPTPAIGGFPREAAMAFIREREELDRGWYAGPIGWVNRHGEGEFAVAIRSAILQGHQATLFAGCGIMADSDPESEYRESCLKLQAMLSILVGPTCS
jgi:isochorismate synthase